MNVSIKELFYCAMMLDLSRIVGIFYDYPNRKDERSRELNNVKRELYNRKLLRENSRGEITLNTELLSFIKLCANPKKCTILEINANEALLYTGTEGSSLLQNFDGECVINSFDCEQAAYEFIAHIRENGGKNG